MAGRVGFREGLGDSGGFILLVLLEVLSVLRAREIIGDTHRSRVAAHLFLLCPFLCPPRLKIGHNLGGTDSKRRRGGEM